ncbi:acyltransferase family protein [Promicromonospora thailandica]|uniref:Peptidoglycan/LPS O-acetylase OafA/YrhL, contains acyltransferase and SGNH-hydrolase domains n=1 Tax=Promicromonospora thailandica TaxID=765201 RepID=A0A9X2GAH7_9MICO|nr:acyltransferase [Promicromonospora thailandica]MCP2266139.1 Peptidoglycan/LPS O-acetylase OafA/YrhL, contains acyltransferase and SGNH-hydrolase domains [Promicromonospora thailandica]
MTRPDESLTAPVPETSPATSGARRKGSGRLVAMDGLRFAAAAAVLLYHFTATSTVSSYWGASPVHAFPLLNEVTRYGWLGVELFFMISGFVILLSADGRGVAGFVASRVGRLFPAYWACIVLTVGLQQFWSGGRQTSPFETLVNLTMVQDLFEVTGVQVVFWTLLVELKFYLLVLAVLALGPLTRTRVLAFATLWPLAGWAAQELGARWLTEWLVPDYAPYFAVGMLLFLAYRDGFDVVTSLLLAGGLILCVLRVLDAAGRASDLQGVPVDPVITVLVLLGCVVAVWATTLPGRSAPSRRVATVLGTFGALTYPVYLVHTQFGYAVIDVLAHETTRTVALVAAGALSLVLAVAIHYGVERPTSARLRRAVQSGLLRCGDVLRSRGLVPSPRG